MMTVDWFRAIVSQIVWIGIGAVLGANARYFISLWMAGKLGLDFPYGTLVVNASGSLLLGFLVAAGSHYLALSPQLRLMMMVGFLGSFTTFSTFAVESVAFWQNERAWGRPCQYPRQQRHQPPVRGARHIAGPSVFEL